MKFVIEIDCLFADVDVSRQIAAEALNSLAVIPYCEAGEKQPLRDAKGNICGEARWEGRGRDNN
jgi:hypothetical protein